jgi:hypothetical protein
MNIVAWDEPHGFTDIDAGITLADIADEVIRSEVYAFEDGFHWSVFEPYVSSMDKDGTPLFAELTHAEGNAITRLAAELEAQAAKESVIRDMLAAKGK